MYNELITTTYENIRKTRNYKTEAVERHSWSSYMKQYLCTNLLINESLNNKQVTILYLSFRNYLVLQPSQMLRSIGDLKKTILY